LIYKNFTILELGPPAGKHWGYWQRHPMTGAELFVSVNPIYVYWMQNGPPGWFV
jgi:hypothetical protein